ncbi:hypothetical protein Mgra_00005865 [Meloidogyne graminicola]|uniref:GLOBIN domain-containing protein n=1 Tax=Meloidogyne graminicola TaxID=189291 RepID=A0A8S9ZML5_9BILA|nr:hypothetical protein Mgra_00005865 [Meloidogyne graminicola]
MGNTCLVTKTINSTKIGTVFVIQQGDNDYTKSGFISKLLLPRRNKIFSQAEISQEFSSQVLTSRDKELISRSWLEHIAKDRKDIFHRTMLYCIEASPKINEIIACGRYCFRDLTKWPKLNRICQAQFVFYEKLIFILALDERKMHEACWELGEMHANYAQYGLKPHFLDIYQQQFLTILAKMDMQDKAETCIAYTHFTSFIIDVMNQAYCQKAADIRMAGSPINRRRNV